MYHNYLNYCIFATAIDHDNVLQLSPANFVANIVFVVAVVVVAVAVVAAAVVFLVAAVMDEFVVLNYFVAVNSVAVAVD